MASKLKTLTSVLAKCMVPDVSNAVKFKVKIMEFDPNLNMHFAKHETIYAHDPTNSCKPGDLALIEKLQNKLTKYITHQVKHVVYPLGDVTDPVTGKKVVAGKYRDEIEATSQLYGANPERFSYENALNGFGTSSSSSPDSFSGSSGLFYSCDPEEPHRGSCNALEASAGMEPYQM
nr:EOG090X0GMQ [Moina brachiata]